MEKKYYWINFKGNVFDILDITVFVPSGLNDEEIKKIKGCL